MSGALPIRKNFLLVIFAVNLIALPLILFFIGQRYSSKISKPIPVYGKIGENFHFTEKSGATVSLDDLRGGLWVADFIFTRCPGQCPMVSLKMSGLQKLLPEKIRFLSFSVDPAHDTPAVLAEYAKNYGIQNGRWLFLAGDKNETNRLLADLHLGKVDEPNAHSLRLILLDAQLRVRGYYDSMDNASLQKLVTDANILLKEVS